MRSTHSREDRICKFCYTNFGSYVVEDDFYFVLLCPLYNHMRSHYIQKYFSHPSPATFISLISSKSHNVIRDIAGCIYYAGKLHSLHLICNMHMGPRPQIAINNIITAYCVLQAAAEITRRAMLSYMKILIKGYPVAARPRHPVRRDLVCLCQFVEAKCLHLIKPTVRPHTEGNFIQSLCANIRTACQNTLTRNRNGGSDTTHLVV